MRITANVTITDFTPTGSCTCLISFFECCSFIFAFFTANHQKYYNKYWNYLQHYFAIADTLMDSATLNISSNFKFSETKEYSTPLLVQEIE